LPELIGNLILLVQEDDSMSDKYAGYIDQSQESRIGSGLAATLAQEAWTPQAKPKMDLNPVSNVLTQFGNLEICHSSKRQRNPLEGGATLLQANFPASKYTEGVYVDGVVTIPAEQGKYRYYNGLANTHYDHGHLKGVPVHSENGQVKYPLGSYEIDITLHPRK
jgi:hypothetical protein